MSFDAFCYTRVEELKGETLDEDMAKEGAFELLSFELGAENNINIGSITGGGGAGKATFKEFTISKKTDTASAGLFYHLVSGKHIDDMWIELRRSGGAEGKSGATFMSFHFALVMIQDMTWSGSDGDDVCEENIVLQFGAIRVKYFKQDRHGKMAEPKEVTWSRVKNNSSMDVE